MRDVTLAAGALEDCPGVVTLLQRLHRPVYDGVRPPDVSVAVGGVVHQVDDACAGRAGADLTEDDLAVMLAVPLHVREPGPKTERRQHRPPHLAAALQMWHRDIP